MARSYWDAAFNPPVSADKILPATMDLSGLRVGPVAWPADPRSTEEKLAYAEELTVEVADTAKKMRKWYG